MLLKSIGITKYLIFTFSILFLLSSGCDCTKTCPGDVSGLEKSVIIVYPFNVSTDNYLYPEIENQSSFQRDSLQVINEDGKIFTRINFGLESDPRNQLKRFYSISIAPAFIIPDDNIAFTTEKTRKIYLKYNYNTSDTLTLVFRAKKGRCDMSEYEYLKIYHRNVLIAQVTEKIFIDFTLKH
jgi:hypothetical protein